MKWEKDSSLIKAINLICFPIQNADGKAGHVFSTGSCRRTGMHRRAAGSGEAELVRTSIFPPPVGAEHNHFVYLKSGVNVRPRGLTSEEVHLSFLWSCP